MKEPNAPAITERIRAAARHVGGGAALARLLGLSQATFSNYMKGRLPKADLLAEIVEKTGVSLDWLVTGKGEMLPGPATPATPAAAQPAPAPGKILPLLDVEALGVALDTIERIYTLYRRTPTSPQIKAEMVIRAYDILMANKGDGIERADAQLQNIVNQFTLYAENNKTRP